ncbi:hypothetical protein GCM10027089_20370 [Nocardia thraciensis]
MRKLGRYVGLVMATSAMVTVAGVALAAPASADRGDAAYYCARDSSDYQQFKRCLNDYEEQIKRDNREEREHSQY